MIQEESYDDTTMPEPRDSLRVVLVLSGLLLLLVGIGGAFYCLATANAMEVLAAATCSGGSPPPPPFCQALVGTASSYRTLSYVMAAVFVGGIAIVITGAIVEEPTTAIATLMPVQWPVAPPDPGRPCSACGRTMPSTDRFCPYCGTVQ